MDNALRHYGVLGMKWGRRKDRQLSSNYDRAERKARQKQANLEKKSASRVRGTMTDDELRQRIQRLQLEKQLRELTEAEVSPGKKFAKEVLHDSGKQAMTQISKNAMMFAGKEFVGKTLGQKDLADALFDVKNSKKNDDSDSSSEGTSDKKDKTSRQEKKKQAKQQEDFAKKQQKAQKTYEREYWKQQQRNAKSQARANADRDYYYQKAEEELRRRRASQRGLSG